MVDAWGTWLGGLGDGLVDGNPFTSNAKTVSPEGSVSDGPVGPMVSGYSIVKAASMDEAVGIAKNCPRNSAVRASRSSRSTRPAPPATPRSAGPAPSR